MKSLLESTTTVDNNVGAISEKLHNADVDATSARVTMKSLAQSISDINNNVDAISDRIDKENWQYI
jgi:predicted  nucleic acid-binding Zn-ribbon protein